MRWRPCLITIVLAALVAGCTTPAPRPSVVQPPPPVSTPAQPAPAPPKITPPPAPDVWDRLRADFALDDCPAPAVQRAQRETRYPRSVENTLRRALPAIDYVQRQTHAHHVPGEFALLPWVESHFREVPPRRHRAAGMWQFMPATAHGLGLPTRRGYDARLDKVASTAAAIKLLQHNHQRLHDWRLANMAYNTGAYRMLRIVREHGAPPPTPVIPDLPVSRTTRQHLIRLLAIACIVREPARFQVTLPTLPAHARLQLVHLPYPVDLQKLAGQLDLPWPRMQRWNAGYRSRITPTDSPLTLLLPAAAAQTFQTLLATGKLVDQGAVAAARDSDVPNSYTVASGDSLWAIAQRHGLTVNQLRRWNDLQEDSLLQPGQTLWLGPSS